LKNFNNICAFIDGSIKKPYQSIQNEIVLAHFIFMAYKLNTIGKYIAVIRYEWLITSCVFLK